jgi:hypothetical protein
VNQLRFHIAVQACSSIHGMRLLGLRCTLRNTQGIARQSAKNLVGYQTSTCAELQDYHASLIVVCWYCEACFDSVIVIFCGLSDLETANPIRSVSSVV